MLYLFQPSFRPGHCTSHPRPLVINFKLKVTFKYQPLNLWNGRKFTSGGPAHLHVNILHSTKCILSICRWFCDDVTRLSRPRLKTWVAEGKQKSQEVPVTGEEAWGGRQGEGAVPGQMQQVFIERKSYANLCLFLCQVFDPTNVAQ